MFDIDTYGEPEPTANYRVLMWEEEDDFDLTDCEAATWDEVFEHLARKGIPLEDIEEISVI